MPGRRRAGQMWMLKLAAALKQLGFEQCQEAPQFFVKRSPWAFLEAHMDDLHGVSSKIGAAEFTREFRALIDVKGGDGIGYDMVYAHLKRFRMRTSIGTYFVG